MEPQSFKLVVPHTATLLRQGLYVGFEVGVRIGASSTIKTANFGGGGGALGSSGVRVGRLASLASHHCC